MSSGHKCESLFVSPPESPLWYDLLLQQKIDVQKLSVKQIKESNRQFLNDLQSYRPPQNSRRARSVLFNEAFDLLDAVKKHEVVGTANKAKYQNSEFAIGYCFGRATFVHLLLLKMGLQKESIFKIWSVGPTNSDTPGVIWDYHVATLVFSRDRGWITIDTGASKPQPVEHWISSQMDKSVDGKVRIYLTGASKFGVYLNKYSRTEMGLDLVPEKDLYFGYFKDMIASLRSRTLESLGLRKIEPAVESESDSFVVETRNSSSGFFKKIGDLFIW